MLRTEHVQFFKEFTRKLHIAQTAGGETPVGSIEYNTLFAVGLLLFILTLIMNVISIWFVRRYRQAY